MNRVNPYLLCRSIEEMLCLAHETPPGLGRRSALLLAAQLIGKGKRARVCPSRLAPLEAWWARLTGLTQTANDVRLTVWEPSIRMVA